MKASDFVPQERQKQRQNTVEVCQKVWDQLVSHGKYRKWTFKQAEAAFFRQMGFKLPQVLRNMPKREADWIRQIGMVPPERLL